jgi:hypothetical protein
MSKQQVIDSLISYEHIDRSGYYPAPKFFSNSDMPIAIHPQTGDEYELGCDRFCWITGKNIQYREAN